MNIENHQPVSLINTIKEGISSYCPHQAHLAHWYRWTWFWVHYFSLVQEWLVVSHSFFACFWALFLAFFFVRDLVKHTAVTSEIPAARAETCLVGHLGSCVLIVSCRFVLQFGLVNIRSVIEQFLIVLKEFFDRAAGFKSLASFRQISLQLLLPFELYVIIRIFCILEVLGPS